jgi:hypothetical protein
VPKTVTPALWHDYFNARSQGMDPRKAALHVGIGISTAYRCENDPNGNSSGRLIFEEWRANNLPPIRDADHLGVDARRALDDFEYFRLRHFGRRSFPWQIAAANQIRALLESPKREYAVINAPPGSGKSVLFTHDIPCWLIARKRSIRIMICSASEARAKLYVEQIIATLERNAPAPLEEEQQVRGAVQAQSCMQADYGRFKPENARRWRAGAFKVAQAGDQVGTTKESTVVAVGLDTRFLGDRVDLLIADDVVTNETTGTAEMREKVLRKWRNEIEKRIEKRGALILQGQRIAAEDLYRTCIDLKAWADPNDPYSDPDARKYTHVVFKAHYDEHCDGQHQESDPAYDPFDPDRGGCLLDPIGLPWPYLMQERADDERTYRTVFQQEDTDPSSVLVNPLWVDGGVDEETGEGFPGCWDNERRMGVNPELASARRAPLSVISVDSSPTKYWAIGRWLFDHDTQRRFLIDLHRAKMQVTQALAHDADRGEYTGVLEEMVREAANQQPSYPVTHLIFEANDAERFFTDSALFRDWCRLRGITLIVHETHRNKTDPKYGFEALLPPVYKYGRVRLPGHNLSGSRKRAMQLVTEVTRYPECATDDCAMQQWFFEHRLPSLASVTGTTARRANMPLLPSRSHLRRVS